jgi:ATP-dependent Lon protease
MAAYTQTNVLPVLPVPDGVVFPGTVVTISLDDDHGRAAVAAARANDGRVVLVPVVTGNYAKVGTIAQVEQAGELPGGQQAAIVRGLQRAELGAAERAERSGLWIQVTAVTDDRPTPRLEAAGRELRVVMEDVAAVRRSRRLPEILRTVTEPGALADAVTSWWDGPVDRKVDVLELVDVAARVEHVLSWAKDLLAEVRVDERIRQDVSEGVERQQREFLLRQQLSAIRKELGEGDDDLGDYRTKLAALTLPDGVRKAIETEIDRLDRTNAQSPEQGWIRTWLDRVLALPWGTRSIDRLDLAHARAVLDADHHGLDDVKDRIVELLAVRKLRAERATQSEGPAVSAPVSRPTRRGDGAIVVLVGPPGVGKTSLGESVARAMDRAFVRVSLGGVRDEAEIRGHRRTYVGAQQGRIARAIAEAGTMNPVILLDEVDKLSSGGWSGDPSAALLEVLDPAQNHTFRDHYLEVDLDLSEVVFLATANTADTIPAPLLDRMELVRLDGYSEDEKVVIARTHLLPRVLERTGLRVDDVELTDGALRAVITGYTREAGVRTLERELGRLLRKFAITVASRTDDTSSTDTEATPRSSVHIDGDDVRTYLGRAKVQPEAHERTTVAGVATGLAVTGIGGDVLFVEASASDGEPGLTLTGQLGDVMKESAQIALSHVRANRERYGVSEAGLARRFHVHVPAGAVPKDGPSAGVTMTTALVSLLTGRTVRPEVGMTGEVTLQGRVLPIGGVKQKVLAAHRAGLTEVVLPKRNEDDLDDVPAKVREAMTFHLAASIDDVLTAALAPAVGVAAVAA